MSAERIQYQNLTMLLFAPSLLSLYAQPAGGDRAVPHDANTALRNSGGEAVLDGSMFQPGAPLSTTPYARQTYGTVLYKHYDANGVNFAGRNPSSGMTISVMPDGSVVAASGSTAAPGARIAVQGYPSLVVAGTPQSVADQSFEYVAALAVMRDGRMAFVVGRGISLPEFARQLADAGARYAYYTDGGGSASLASLSGYVGSSEHRPVLTWLVARPSGVSVSGSSGLVIAAVLALAAGVGWWWHVSRDVKSFRGMALPRRNPTLQVVEGTPIGTVARYTRDDGLTLEGWIEKFNRGGAKGRRQRMRGYKSIQSRESKYVVEEGKYDDNGSFQGFIYYDFAIKNGRLVPMNRHEGGQATSDIPFWVYLVAEDMFAAERQHRSSARRA